MDTQVTLPQAEEALRVVQSLEPPGVGARTLQECLLLQLDKRQADYEFLRKLITEHFDDVLRNRYPQVAKAMECSIDELKEAVEKIGKLNPIPGTLFPESAPPHVIPDLRVDDVDGEFVVTLEDSWLPSLRICAYYAERLQRKDLDQKTREYLQKKLQSAQGLIAAIEQRRSTVYNVATEIMKVQKSFIEKGDMYLAPLKMQDVADKVGVHVSTVSRAISEKYVQTPQGIYSLKHFFTGGVAKQDGEVESWEVVRQKLQQIIDTEDKSNPLNDEDIAAELKKQGIDIARRTVTKYRKGLKIPSSRMRKQY
jgi:RNA polymerase sigma-54 factor